MGEYYVRERRRRKNGVSLLVAEPPQANSITTQYLYISPFHITVTFEPIIEFENLRRCGMSLYYLTCCPNIKYLSQKLKKNILFLKTFNKPGVAGAVL